MKHSKIERPALPRRLPPRWMVAPYLWPEIELREQQAGYQVTRSVADEPVDIRLASHYDNDAKRLR